MSRVIILTGHSGSGKDTVSERLQDVADINPITPHTTRAMREGESEGNPYHFISQDEFAHMVITNRFLEHKSYTTQFGGVEEIARYGTAFKSIPKVGTSIVTIGVLAALGMKKILGKRATVIYLDVSDAVREERAKARGSFDQVEWDNRLTQDHIRFKDGLPDGIDVSINNMQSMDATVHDILAYIKQG